MRLPWWRPVYRALARAHLTRANDDYLRFYVELRNAQRFDMGVAIVILIALVLLALAVRTWWFR